MADSTINGLTALAAASVVPGTDVAPVWQGSASTTKKVTIADLVTAGNTFGTITASSPATISQTWNNVAVTFTGKLVSITDTASNAASLFQDWQVGGSSKLSIVKTGKILGNGANPYLFLDNSVGSQFGYGTGILNNGGTSLTWAVGGTEVARVDNAGLFSVASGGGYQWSSTTASSGTKDLILLRDAAATLAQRNGTTAQSFRVYNTYTDASNFERGTMDWATTANTLTIGSAKAGTGTARSVNLIAGGVVAMTIGTAADVQIPKTVTAAGTTGAQTINKQSGTVNFAAAATSLVVTNSFVTTSSIIVATVGTNDTTMKIVNAVAAAGSFTLNANAAATAETRVNFVVLN